MRRARSATATTAPDSTELQSGLVPAPRKSAPSRARRRGRRSAYSCRACRRRTSAAAAFVRRPSPIGRRWRGAPDEGTPPRRASDKAMTAKHPHPRPFSRREKGGAPPLPAALARTSLSRCCRRGWTGSWPDSIDGGDFVARARFAAAQPTGGRPLLQKAAAAFISAKKKRTMTREASRPTI
jgi:hypothetical protein